MSESISIPSNIQAIVGPYLIGNLIGYGLLGILMSQVFVYYHRFPNDRVWLKVLVWSQLFLDIFNTMLGTLTSWEQLVSGWGNAIILDPVPWHLSMLPPASALVATCTHTFYCWRMWKLRQSLLLPIMVFTVSLITVGIAAYCGIHGRQIGLLRVGHDLEPYVIVWLGGSAAVDIVITVVMVMTLFRAQAQASFRETSSGIARLITLTVETGMITAIGAAIEMVLFVLYPSNNLHFLPFFFLSKLYTNTLLATLNSRGLMGDHRHAAAILWNDDSRVYSPSYISSFAARPSIPPTGIQMSTTTERLQDDDLELYVLEKEASPSKTESHGSNA